MPFKRTYERTIIFKNMAVIGSCKSVNKSLPSIFSIIFICEKETPVAVLSSYLKIPFVPKLLDMSADFLQNLRVTGKIRFKKVLGSYYYSKADIMNLFNDKQLSYRTAQPFKIFETV